MVISKAKHADKSLMLAITVLVLLSFAAVVNGRPPSSFSRKDVNLFATRSTTATATATSAVCNSSERSIFGGASMRNLLAMRGGEGGLVQEVSTLEEVERIIAAEEEEGGKLVVLYFTANNCPPCKMIAPVYEELSVSEEFEDKVIFLKVNVDESPETAAKFNVDGWPTFLFLKKGRLLSEMVGGNAAREGLYAMVSLWASM